MKWTRRPAQFPSPASHPVCPRTPSAHWLSVIRRPARPVAPSQPTARAHRRPGTLVRVQLKGE